MPVCPSVCEKIVPVSIYIIGKLYQRLKWLLYEKELVNKNNGYSHFTFITVVNLSFGHIQCLQAGTCKQDNLDIHVHIQNCTSHDLVCTCGEH